MVLKLKSVRFIRVLPLAAVLCVGAALLCFAESAASGAAMGLKLCAGVIVPSLFPFLVLGSFASLSPSCIRAMRLFSPLMRHLFRLPAAAAAAVVFGFAGGYPLGCSVAAKLLENGSINEEQAQRISCFCVNSGPAFIITAVGAVMLGNVKAGVIIFASTSVSALIIGILLGFTAAKPDKEQTYCGEKMNDLQAFVQSAEAGAKGIIKICAWTVLFSCMTQILHGLGLDERFVSAAKYVLEVTVGCQEASANGNYCAVAAVLGWGGLCVGCQVMSDVRRIKTPAAVFFSFRALHGAMSAIICKVLLNAFPVEQSVFSNISTVSVRNFSYSLPATAALLGLCIVFIIDLDRNKKIC